MLAVSRLLKPRALIAYSWPLTCWTLRLGARRSASGSESAAELAMSSLVMTKSAVGAWLSGSSRLEAERTGNCASSSIDRPDRSWPAGGWERKPAWRARRRPAPRRRPRARPCRPFRRGGISCSASSSRPKASLSAPRRQPFIECSAVKVKLRVRRGQRSALGGTPAIASGASAASASIAVQAATFWRSWAGSTLSSVSSGVW